jgi:hypothetical protein
MSTSGNDWDRDEQEALGHVRDQLDAIRERHRLDPPLDVLRAASAGVLPPEAQASVDEHLAKNAWSRALVDGASPDEAALDAESSKRLLERIESQAAKERAGAGAFGWLRPVMFASGIFAAAAVAWLLVRAPEEPSASPEPVATVATAPAPAPAPFQLAFDTPDVRLSMAALTWRGEPGDNPLLADLRPALDAYRQGDYAAADRHFSTLADRYPGTIEILFYQGVSRLLLNDAAGADAVLAEAEKVADSTFIDDVRWYRAVAEQHAGNTAQARARLEALCMEKTASSARACTALDEVDKASRPTP